MDTKICTKCKQSFPANLDYFHKQKKGYLGLRSVCKGCLCLLRKEYVKNPEVKKKLAAYQRKYNAEHPEIIKPIQLRSAKKRRVIFNKTQTWKYHNDPEFREKKKVHDKKRTILGKCRKASYTKKAWEKHLEIARESKKKAMLNPIIKTKYLLKQRAQRTANINHYREVSKKQTKNLASRYIKQVLTQKEELLSASDIPLELIELKRKQLKLKRDAKKIKS